jgi:chromosomal replication initiator protein
MARIGGWEAVRDAVRERVGLPAFQAWFGALDGQVDGDRLVVRCPDRFSREWIQGRYGRVLEEVSGASAIDYEVAPARLPSAPQEPSRPPTATRPTGPSFDGFVAGPGNALALEAARAVARGVAGRCSPLVLCSDPGLGKTHLCRAIRSEAGDGAVYRSSEEFTSEVTQSLRAGRMEQVRHRYRRMANLLILEDVQFLEGKRATQIELFHTLDHLLAHERSVVFTSNRPPHELSGLDEALRSRMGSGLVARIAPPELETRRAILREKAASGGVRIPDDCLEALATRSVRSVRDLVAGLNQVVAHATLLRRPVTPDLVAAALADMEVAPAVRSLEEIVALVGASYGLDPERLRARTRERRVARPRQVAMYLCRRYTDASLARIGAELGRDHTSVMHAIRAVEQRIAERPQLRYELEAIARRINGPEARGASGNTPGTRRT